MKTNLNDFFWFGYTNQKFNLKSEQNNYKLKTSPLIQGKKVSLDKAIGKLKEVFNKKETVHFDGLICDQGSLGSILSLAEKSRSSVNHVENDEIKNFYSAYQKYGASLLSFNELRKRSDLIIFIGNFDRYILESFIKNIDWGKTKTNNSVFLFSEKFPSVFKNEFKYKNLEISADIFINLFGENTTESRYEQLQKKIKVSKYPVIIINPCNSFILIQQIFKNFAYINNNLKKVRMFRISGLNNSSGFVNCCVTKTGFPGSISFTDWGVSYDPENYNAIRQKDYKKTQIYISNLNSDPKVLKFKKNIFVGHPNHKNKVAYDIYIPVKTPGFDTNGLVVRSDGSGVLKLEKRIESDYIGINDLIDQLMSKND